MLLIVRDAVLAQRSVFSSETFVGIWNFSSWVVVCPARSVTTTSKTCMLPAGAPMDSINGISSVILKSMDFLYCIWLQQLNPRSSSYDTGKFSDSTLSVKRLSWLMLRELSISEETLTTRLAIPPGALILIFA